MVWGIYNTESKYVPQYGSKALQNQLTKRMENDSVKLNHKKIKNKNESAGAFVKGLATVGGIFLAIKKRAHLGKIFKGAWNGIKGLFTSAKTVVSKNTKKVVDGVKDMAPKAKTTASDKVKKAMDSVESMHIKDKVTGTFRSIKNVLLKKS